MFLVPYDSPVPPSAWTKWGNTCETNKPGRCWLRSSSSSSALEADRASSHLNSRVPNLSPTNHLFQEATLLISSAFADFLVTCDMWPTNLLLLNHPEASPNLCFCLFWLWQNLYRNRSYIDSQQFWPASTLTHWPASLSAVRLLPCRAQCRKMENCHEMVKNSEVVCQKEILSKASFLVILKTCAWIILYYSSTSLYYHQKVYYTRGKPYISALSSEYLSIWVYGCWSSKGALLWLCYSCLSPPYLLLRSFSITQLSRRDTISKTLDFLKTYQTFR